MQRDIAVYGCRPSLRQPSRDIRIKTGKTLPPVVKPPFHVGAIDRLVDVEQFFCNVHGAISHHRRRPGTSAPAGAPRHLRSTFWNW